MAACFLAPPHQNSRTTMKTNSDPLRVAGWAGVAFALIACSPARADIVYVTSNVSNCAAGAECQIINQDFNPNTGYPVYTDNGYGAFTSAKATAPAKPPTAGGRYFSNSFSNSTPDIGITLNPALGEPGGIYQIYHVFSSAAGNVSSNIMLGVTVNSGGSLSFTNTDKFQSRYGAAVGGVNVWQLLGFLTNDPGSANPMITFYFEGGNVNAGALQRLLTDTFRFVKYEPCLDVPVATVTGPLATNTTAVAVIGVTNLATRVDVYQNTGAGMVAIGSTNVAEPGNTVHVAVSGLVKGAQVAATQTVNGQEGCRPTTGTLVGGGANPPVRVALNIRANTALTGPVGAAGSGSTIYFLGSGGVLPGGAPSEGVILTPSTNWQTITFTRGDVTNGMPVDPNYAWFGTATFEGDYGALDGLAIASEGDTGPYELYLDDLSNGVHGIVQGWESATNGASAYQFSAPSFSGSTAVNLLAAPNQAVVTSDVAASGNNSLRVRFQFNDPSTNMWLRLVTTGNVGAPANPQLDLNEPISIKVLLPPPGTTVAAPGPGPISVSHTPGASQLTLNWSGSYQLQSSPTAGGPYTDVTGVTTSPYAVNVGAESLFFRLRR